MLDFYLIDDEYIKPNYPKELTFAGGLENQTFENLQRKNVIDSRFDYYSDFRWGTTLIKQVLENIIKRDLQADTDVQQLVKLLEIAAKNKNGLIAYAD